ncbi:MAG: DUF1858 domain-containing protein [Anaerolineae bacterium]|nr:DUF1858 domain-containing protein [Anaerolineae bacterium]
MDPPSISADLTVAEILSRWPQTVPVFLRHRLACVGCVMAPFETLTDITLIYQLNLDLFIKELQQAILFTAEDQEDQ